MVVSKALCLMLVYHAALTPRHRDENMNECALQKVNREQVRANNKLHVLVYCLFRLVLEIPSKIYRLLKVLQWRWHVCSHHL